MTKEYQLIEFDSIPSTNSFLKENYEILDDFTVAKAHHQTKGRGRSGNTWVDEDGSLLFSILIKDRNIIENVNINIIPILVSIAVSKAIEQIYEINTLIKWPNDIIINDKKICGILLESVVTDKIDAIVIGIGINCNNKIINEEVKHKASSLYLESNKEIDTYRLLHKILINLNEEFSLSHDVINEGSLEYYNLRNYLYNKTVSFNYNSEDLTGVSGKIENDGKLVIDCDKLVVKLYYGEVSLSSSYK